MKIKSNEFEAIMPESSMLDEEMNALRGGVSGKLINVTCAQGKTPDGGFCDTGTYKYSPTDFNDLQQGGANDNKATKNP